MNDVLKAEVNGVLVQARKKTIQASAKAIKAYYTLDQTASGKSRFITFENKIYCLTNRFGDSTWAKISAFRKGQMKQALARRGLSRAGWSRIGRDLDLPSGSSNIKAGLEKYVAHLVSGQKKQSGGKISMRIDYGIMAGILGAGAQRALENAVLGRQKYFSMNVKRGVFKKVATMAKKYPGIKIVGI